MPFTGDNRMLSEKMVNVSMCFRGEWIKDIGGDRLITVGASN